VALTILASAQSAIEVEEASFISGLNFRLYMELFWIADDPVYVRPPNEDVDDNWEKHIHGNQPEFQRIWGFTNTFQIDIPQGTMKKRWKLEAVSAKMHTQECIQQGKYVSSP
jgi:hypothetical protein